MIRLFKEGDAPRCREIIKDCFNESVTLEEKAKEFMKETFTKEGYLESKIKEHQIFVCEKEGRVLGMGGIKGNVIKKFYVDPSEQGKGIGTELLHHVEKIAVKNGCHELILYAFENAVEFYARNGYKATRIIRVCSFIKNALKFYAKNKYKAIRVIKPRVSIKNTLKFYAEDCYKIISNLRPLMFKRKEMRKSI